MIAGDHRPSYWPEVRTQYVYSDSGNSNSTYLGEADCCVACTLATIKDLHQYKYNTGMTGEVGNYSSYWIYGNRLSTDQQGEGMVYVEAMQRLRDDGAIAGKVLNDNMFYYDKDGYAQAKTTVANQFTAKISQANLGRITGWNYYEAPSTDSVITTIQNSIMNHGAAMLAHWTFYEFYNIPSTGVVPYVTLDYSGASSSGSAAAGVPTEPPPAGGASPVVTGHSVALIGWTYRDGVMHWIGQNSWGRNWGYGGYCYIPYDHPMVNESGTVHTMEDVPSVPNAFTGIEVYPSDTSASIYFDDLVRVDKIVVNYRERGTTDWIEYKRYEPAWSVRLNYEADAIFNPNVPYEIKLYATNAYGNGEPAYILGDNAITYVKNVRPVNWSWSTAKVSGSAVNITASEWNGFTDRIKEFLTYKGLDPNSYGFTAAISGQPMKASQANQALTAIRAMTSTYANQSIGGDISAKFFNDIRDHLNSIP